MYEESESQKKWSLIPHYRILAILILAAVLGWIAFLLVVQKLDPYTSTGLALALFFGSSTVAAAGTFSIILFFFKKWRFSDNVYIKHILISLRQGILLSICTNLCLALLMLGLLRLWNGILLIAIMMLLEFYWSGKDEE
jgi:hypothetical protein